MSIFATLLDKLRFVKNGAIVTSKGNKSNIESVEFDARTTYVLLGKIDRYPRDSQLEDCQKAVKTMKLPAIGDSIYEHDEMKQILRDLRGDEALVLPRLDVAGEHMGRGVGNRYLNNIIMLTNQTHVIIDVHESIMSHDYGDWYEHIKATYRRLTNSRKPTPGHNKKIGKLKPTKPGIVRHWTEYVDEETFTRNAQHWRDPHHANAEEAIATLPDEELREASKRTIERIFGNRT